MIKGKIYKWLFFVLALLGLLFGLEKAFDFGLKHNLNLKASYVFSHKIDADILMLGPCEPLWMVSPEIITKKTGLSCYNLAESHSDFADNYAHLVLYLKNNKAPRYLLLYVTPESFDTNYNTFHGYRFSPFFGDKTLSDVMQENCSTPFTWRYVPFMRYAYYNHQSVFGALQGWKHYLTGREKPYFADGFEPPARITWDNHHENLKKAYPKGYFFNWDGRRERYFERILSLHKPGSTEIVLYESPILKEITDYQVNRPLVLDRIEKIARKRGVGYIRFDELPWASDRKYFISPMVTTLAGSYLFSDTLGGYLREKIVK